MRPVQNFFASLIAAAACVGTLALARPALADEPVRTTFANPDEYPPTGTQLPLAAVALGATAGWYGAAVGFSYLFPDAPGATDLRVPVAGPWMALGKSGCADDDPGCSKFVVVLRAILTTMDAVGQTGAVAVMGEALFMPTMEVAPGTERRPLPRLRRTESFTVHPVPYVAGKDGVGLGVVGSF
jgi:hypothetical protein